ncbi:MAG: hypothetical protein WCF92_03695 [bacterium]
MENPESFRSSEAQKEQDILDAVRDLFNPLDDAKKVPEAKKLLENFAKSQDSQRNIMAVDIYKKIRDDLAFKIDGCTVEQGKYFNGEEDVTDEIRDKYSDSLIAKAIESHIGSLLESDVPENADDLKKYLKSQENIGA